MYEGPTPSKPETGYPPPPNLRLGPPPPKLRPGTPPLNVNRQTPVKTVPSRRSTYAGGNKCHKNILKDQGK